MIMYFDLSSDGTNYGKWRRGKGSSILCLRNFLKGPDRGRRKKSDPSGRIVVLHRGDPQTSSPKKKDLLKIKGIEGTVYGGLTIESWVEYTVEVWSAGQNPRTGDLRVPRTWIKMVPYMKETHDGCDHWRGRGCKLSPERRKRVDRTTAVYSTIY